MYALYCLHQTQVLVPAEVVRVTPFVLALLVRLERRLLLLHFMNPCGAAGVVTSMLDRECFQTTAYPGATGYASIDRFARVHGCGFNATMVDATSHTNEDVADDSAATSQNSQPASRDEMAPPPGGLFPLQESVQDDQLIDALMDDEDDTWYL